MRSAVGYEGKRALDSYQRSNADFKTFYRRLFSLRAGSRVTKTAGSAQITWLKRFPFKYTIKTYNICFEESP